MRMNSLLTFTGAGVAARSLLGMLLAGALLAGCSSSPKGGVQVVDRDGRGASKQNQRQPASSGQYVVQRGDTLYSIAFRFGWDWKTLAARNGIPAPYVIRSGQIIRFGSSSAVAQARSSAPVTRSTPAVPVITQVQAPAKPIQNQAPARPVAVVTPPAAATPPSTAGWGWPAKGAVIGRFSSNGSLNKGIDIAGELGEPVFAASDGAVVYAGSGLRGYGELIIIKHSDTYVSAYGHNRRLLVREGQQVKVGQSIAEMGSTGTDRVKLHFEIRRQGKPVDPLQYLPRR